MSNDQKHLFCFGLGYSAERLARDLIDSDNGWTVAGTSRSEEKTECLNKIGVKTLFFDGEQPISRVEKWLESATHLVISAPPGPQGDPVLRYHKDDIAQLSNLEWVGYLSTTGVYGDKKGEWVDETAELTPTSPRGYAGSPQSALGWIFGVPIKCRFICFDLQEFMGQVVMLWRPCGPVVLGGLINLARYLVVSMWMILPKFSKHR